jgi:hypothetical protein
MYLKVLNKIGGEAAGLSITVFLTHVTECMINSKSTTFLIMYLETPLTEELSRLLLMA